LKYDEQTRIFLLVVLLSVLLAERKFIGLSFTEVLRE